MFPCSKLLLRCDARLKYEGTSLETAKIVDRPVGPKCRCVRPPRCALSAKQARPASTLQPYDGDPVLLTFASLYAVVRAGDELFIAQNDRPVVASLLGRIVHEAVELLPITAGNQRGEQRHGLVVLAGKERADQVVAKGLLYCPTSKEVIELLTKGVDGVALSQFRPARWEL
jgi:hypothetical protein